MTLLTLSFAAGLSVFAGLFLGGLSKGSLGVGLPLVSVPILAFFMPVPQALVILTVPIFLTNVWQSIEGGNLRVVFKRFWPVLLALILGLGLGAQILVRLEERTLYLIMGLMMLTQPLVLFLKPQVTISSLVERRLGIAAGLIGGFLGGMSGFYGPLILTYLSALRLDKDMFTSAVALLFLFGGVAFALFLAQLGVMKATDLIASSLALIPTAIGIFVGQKIRSRISQPQFEKSLTFAMLFMGLSMLVKAF
jgi:uncharacterized membrane protein YfcA